MYTVMEYVINGSKMMNPYVMAFDMSFEESVKRMKEILSEKIEDIHKLEITIDTNEQFSYIIWGGFLPLCGVMKNEKLLIHKNNNKRTSDYDKWLENLSDEERQHYDVFGELRDPRDSEY